MPKFSFTKIVNVDRDKIFNVITDFENLAKIFPKYFKSLKIISKSGNITKLEEELEFLGKKLNVTVDHIVEEPDKHTVIMLDGPGKNTKFEEIFEKIPEGTKITVDVDLVLNGKFKVMGFFAKKQIKNKMSQALDEFAEVAKNNLCNQRGSFLITCETETLPGPATITTKHEASNMRSNSNPPSPSKLPACLT